MSMQVLPNLPTPALSFVDTNADVAKTHDAHNIYTFAKAVNTRLPTSLLKFKEWVLNFFSTHTFLDCADRVRPVSAFN